MRVVSNEDYDVLSECSLRPRLGPMIMWKET